MAVNRPKCKTGTLRALTYDDVFALDKNKICNACGDATTAPPTPPIDIPPSIPPVVDNLCEHYYRRVHIYATPLEHFDLTIGGVSVFTSEVYTAIQNVRNGEVYSQTVKVGDIKIDIYDISNFDVTYTGRGVVTGVLVTPPEWADMSWSASIEDLFFDPECGGTIPTVHDPNQRGMTIMFPLGR